MMPSGEIPAPRARRENGAVGALPLAAVPPPPAPDAMAAKGAKLSVLLENCATRVSGEQKTAMPNRRRERFIEKMTSVRVMVSG